MYAYLNGKLSYKSPTLVHLDVGGIGFELHISLYTYSKIEKLNAAKLHCYLHVKEDGHSLYGFADEEEKTLFIQLISVSGVGPNTARIVLSSLNPAETRQAILTEDDLLFKKVKGVGPKTAKRIILDLKDKVGKIDTSDISFGSGGHSVRTEAAEALIALGFQRTAVQKAFNQLKSDNSSNVEQLIKEALKLLT